LSYGRGSGGVKSKQESYKTEFIIANKNTCEILGVYRTLETEEENCETGSNVTQN
jgi:hypothetical protein